MSDPELVIPATGSTAGSISRTGKTFQPKAVQGRHQQESLCATRVPLIEFHRSHLGHVSDSSTETVSAELNAQRERGETPNLESAIDNAKTALFDRIGHALSNSGRDTDAGLDVFEGYWNRHGGSDAAVDAGYGAYDDFLADTTLIDNPSYEDNLNALASALAGGTLTDTRNILHLRPSPSSTRT